MACYTNAAFESEKSADDNSFSNKTDTQDQSGNCQWDIFQETIDQTKFVRSEEIWKSLERILTIVFIFFLFCVCLGTGVLSRTILHIMIWHLNPPQNSSLKEVNTLAYHINTTPTSLPNSYNTTEIYIETNYTTTTENFRLNTSTTKPEERLGIYSTSSYLDENWIWSIYLIMIAPYLVTVLTSFKTMCLKGTGGKLNYTSLFIILVIESFHSIGLCCLVYLVLPMFYPPTASVVCLTIMTIPPVVDIIDSYARQNYDTEKITYVSLISSIIGVVLQILAIVMIAYYVLISEYVGHSVTVAVVFIVSVVFVSLKYWKNYVQLDAHLTSKWLTCLNLDYQVRRIRVIFVANCLKIIVCLLSVIIIHGLKASDFPNGIKSIFNIGTVNLQQIFGNHKLGMNDKCGPTVPFVMAVVNICSSYICSKAAKTACVIGCQRLCFSLTLILVPPASLIVLGVLMYYPDIIQLTDCVVYFAITDSISMQMVENIWPLIVAGISIYLSIIFITRHIWKTNGYCLGKTQSLFTQPSYCGINSDISLLLNRSRDDHEYEAFIKKEREQNHASKQTRQANGFLNISPMSNNHSKIYACATMWHETETEMTQLLKSIFRMDKHQNKLKNAKQLTSQHNDQNDMFDYEFEAHIFFDDAFEVPNEKSTNPEVNEYVKILFRVMNTAASAVHGILVESERRKMERTPYGGKVTWKLSGENKLVVHLKDKMKIRHRKRWSQVMYMYYFLGHSIGNKTDKSVIREEASNTFLLALDGDVDFQPEAVMHLVRRMRKNPIVGAACGRIHPIGAGPLVWYQKFEYAISHWLQKATEHVIGCVLCSPGCFSLFRGSALMEVLKTYTKIPTEARHFIQYDQGEDRWLCTLLLKQGYRVEYCAESDALTFAPEGFNEFYNQRRRWTPSTIANIIDLLNDWNRVVKQNQNVSTIYMAYQLFLLISSLLTPGTIFLMILGAIIVGFPSVPPWLALILNVIPVGLFMLSCIFTKSETQLFFAGVLSSIYAVAMMIVLVGLLKEAAEQGFHSTTTIFLCFVAGVFIVSALLHPKELLCLIHGILYFVSIPSMSMLLILYSLGNLHVVSWGTREVKKAVTAPVNKVEKMEALEVGYTCSLGKLFRCIWCPTGGLQNHDIMYKHILDKLQSLESQTTITNKEEFSQRMHIEDESEKNTDTSANEDEQDRNGDEDSSEPDQIHATLNYSQFQQLEDANEIAFWESLIEKYLKPLDKNEASEKQIQGDLIDLRNRCCLFFFLLNTLLVTVIYALTQTDSYNKVLTINAFCYPKCISIEPISITFTLVFGLLLLIQFICLIFHRVSTLIHITASTQVCTKPSESDEAELFIDILQRSGSIQNKSTPAIEDYKCKFENEKNMKIEHMIEKGKKQRTISQLNLDETVKTNLTKYRNIGETVETNADKYENQDYVESGAKINTKTNNKNGLFTNLTPKERKIMCKYLEFDVGDNKQTQF